MSPVPTQRTRSITICTAALCISPPIPDFVGNRGRQAARCACWPGGRGIPPGQAPRRLARPCAPRQSSLPRGQKRLREPLVFRLRRLGNRFLHAPFRHFLAANSLPERAAPVKLRIFFFISRTGNDGSKKGNLAEGLPLLLPLSPGNAFARLNGRKHSSALWRDSREKEYRR